ncbi:hypothetical protein WN943_018838 [Citrus x changshan-huyou]
MASSENAISAVERGCEHGCLARPRIVCLVAAGATMDLLCLVPADAIKTKAKAHDLVRFADCFAGENIVEFAIDEVSDEELEALQESQKRQAPSAGSLRLKDDSFTDRNY